MAYATGFPLANVKPKYSTRESQPRFVLRTVLQDFCGFELFLYIRNCLPPDGWLVLRTAYPNDRHARLRYYRYSLKLIFGANWTQ
jgi:hypothetical protein